MNNDQNEITTFVAPRPILPGVILTEDSDYETWKAHMRNEVRSFQFEHLVYDVPQNVKMTKNVEEAARAWLVTYISARIAESYRKTICYSNITDPKQILEKLENIRNPVSSLTGTTIYRRWASISYDPTVKKEEPEEFIDRFNCMLMKARKTTQISDADAVNNFVGATQGNFREVQYYKLANPNLMLSELQEFLRQLIADKKEAEERISSGKPTAALAAEVKKKNADIRKNVDNKCRRCGRLGHHQSECYSTKWICYGCERLVDNHEADTCPLSEGGNYCGASAVRRGRGRGFWRSRGPRFGNRFRGSSRGNRFKRVKLVGPDKKVSYGFIAEDENEYYNHTAWYDSYDFESSENCPTVYFGECMYESEKEKVDKPEVEASGSSEYNDINFVCDSGATEHMVNSIKGLVNVREINNPVQITSANAKSKLTATKYGTLVTRLLHGRIVKIKNILYAEKLTKNLLSLRKLTLNGFNVLLSHSGIKIIDVHSNMIVKTGGFNGRFWYLNFKLENCENLNKVECFVNESINEMEIEDEHNYAIKNASVEHNDHDYARKARVEENEGSSIAVPVDSEENKGSSIAVPVDSEQSSENSLKILQLEEMKSTLIQNMKGAV